MQRKPAGHRPGSLCAGALLALAALALAAALLRGSVCLPQPLPCATPQTGYRIEQRWYRDAHGRQRCQLRRRALG